MTGEIIAVIVARTTRLSQATEKVISMPQRRKLLTRTTLKTEDLADNGEYHLIAD